MMRLIVLICDNQRVRIVLVEPTHPGNIGATARAMKTMGFFRLVLVSPKLFPHHEATGRAAGADDVLEQAVIVDHLAEGLSGCDWVIGASARFRTLPRHVYDPKTCVRTIMQQPDRQVAFVFGRESSGLHNDELALCHDQIHIPTNENFSSLNLAAAVQIIVYELRMAMLLEEKPIQKTYSKEEPLATAEQMSGFYDHLRNTLIQIDFLNVKQPKRLMERLQMLFNRSQLTVTELNIMRGILRAMNKKTE